MLLSGRGELKYTSGNLMKFPAWKWSKIAWSLQQKKKKIKLGAVNYELFVRFSENICIYFYDEIPLWFFYWLDLRNMDNRQSPRPNNDTKKKNNL